MKFTKRDIEIVSHLACGLNTIQIAEKMRHTASTVETYRTRMLKKHGAKNSAQMVSIAYQRGVLKIDEMKTTFNP